MKLVKLFGNVLSNIMEKYVMFSLCSDELNTLPDHWKFLQSLLVMLENYGEMGYGFIYIEVY